MVLSNYYQRFVGTALVTQLLVVNVNQVILFPESLKSKRNWLVPGIIFKTLLSPIISRKKEGGRRTKVNCSDQRVPSLAE